MILTDSEFGEYNTCMHLCRYCYANEEPAVVFANNRLHDPASPFLIGNEEKECHCCMNWNATAMQLSLSTSISDKPRWPFGVMEKEKKNDE